MGTVKMLGVAIWQKYCMSQDTMPIYAYLWLGQCPLWLTPPSSVVAAAALADPSSRGLSSAPELRLDFGGVSATAMIDPGSEVACISARKLVEIEANAEWADVKPAPYTKAITTVVSGRPQLMSVATITFSGVTETGEKRFHRADFAVIPSLLGNKSIDVLLPCPQPPARARQEFWDHTAPFLPNSDVSVFDHPSATNTPLVG